MNSPLTTVIIPAYNAERFVERTLRSALRQTYSNLEVILVDDGSTDQTKSIVEAIATNDARVRVISVPNGGVAKARNIGIENASGEFVAFLDADDLWHPTKIELQVASLESKGAAPEPVAAYTLSRLIDAEDRFIRNKPALGSSGYTFARHLFAKPIGNGSSMLVRRDIALAVGGFDSTWAARGIGGCEDFDFELKVVSKYPVVSLPYYLVGYRWYPGNMSSNRLRMARGLVATVEQHIRSNPGLPHWAARNARASTLEYAVVTLVYGRHWVLVAPDLFRLLRADFGRGVESAAVLFRDIIGRLVRNALKRKPDPVRGPFFYDLSPDLGVDLLVRRVRDRKILDRMKELDRSLAERITQRRADGGNHRQPDLAFDPRKRPTRGL